MSRAVAGLGLAGAFACVGWLAGCGGSHGAAVPGTAADASLDQLSTDGPVYTFSSDTGGDDGGDAAPAGGTAFFSSDSLDFGSIDCGGPPGSQTLTIINQGLDPLSVSAMTTGTAFSVSPTSLTVPANMMADLTVTATVPGSASAGTKLTGSMNLVTSDSMHSNVTVRLSVTPTGGTMALKATSSSISFPASEVNEPTAQVFVVTNSGNAPATITVSAPSNPLFSLYGQPDGGVTLNAGDTWTGTATFLPPDTSVATATSTVTVTGATCGTGLASISFSGQGATGQVTGWPTAPVDFGLASCGGGAPAPQSFLLSNASTVDARIMSVSITPPGSGFATDATAGKFIAANGGSRLIHVTAPPVPSPSPLTPITATLSIQTDADTSPHAITLQEEPQGAVLAFDPSATPNFGSFGEVVLLLSATQSFSVKNTGNAPANVTLGTGAPAGGDDGGTDATTAPPPPFAISNSSFSIDPRGTQTDAVTFAPTAGTAYQDRITMSATGSICSPMPSPLALSGVGLGGGPSLTRSVVAFTPTCGGQAPDGQIVTLTNSGPADLTWSLSPITGPGAAQYTVTARRLPGLLPPGQHADIAVTAAAIPSPAPNPDPAALAAQFTITTDVPFDNPHVVALTETPLGDQLSFSVQSLRFGQYPIDHMTPQQTFTVTNAANPGSPAANATLALTGPGGAVSVQPEDGGTVCIVPGDGEALDGGAACPVIDAGDGGADSGDGGDSGEGGDGGGGPETVVAGYFLAPSAVTNLGPGGTVSSDESVTFVPTAATPYPATIAIRTSDALCTALPAPLQLTGTGTQGHVSVSATTVALGTDPKDPHGLVNCGTTGLPETFSVSNTGNQSFNIVGLSLGKGTSSPFTLSGAGTALPAALPIGRTVPITVTPGAMPQNVVDPNDPSAFSDTLTITTDAALDTPHNVSLVMQARGAVIADRPLDSNWNFGTIGLGSIGTFTTGIRNIGNAPASVTIQGLGQPLIFGLQNDPTTVPPNGAAAMVGQFAPPAANGSWTDQGTLVVTTPQVFCQPLPAAWNSPTITFSGSSSGNPPIAVSGSLAFPSSSCGSAAPAGQTLTLANATNQTYAYALRFSSGAFYVIADAGPGTIGANSTATIAITPKTISPAQGVQPGSAPYADSLIVSTSPAGAGDAGSSNPAAPSFTIPISWTLHGAVLALPEGAGPNTDSLGNAYYPADTATGFALPMDNGGNAGATVTFTMAPSNAFAFSSATPISLPAGVHAAPQLTSTASDAVCPATTNATLTFFYSGPICQPFQLQSVSVHACVGTL